jgi:large subunit ribosomal protein L4e
MKADILSLEGKKIKSIDLPSQFSEEYRSDLINRAVLAIFSHKRQSYGAFERAGKQQSAKLSRRRHNYKTAYGIGISRVPRKTMWRRGTQFGWVGAFAPGMVGGRKAHPPKPGKIWDEKINRKERRKAIRSALAGTIIRELNNNYDVPFVIENRFEDISKAKDVEKIFDSLKLTSELERCREKTIRAGVGKLRGRKYKKNAGLLLVTGNNEKLKTNVIDVTNAKSLNVTDLANGGAGRLTMYTEEAIKNLGERLTK